MNYINLKILLFSVIILTACKENKPSSKIGLEVKREIMLDDSASSYLHSLYPIASSSKTKNLIAIPNKKSPVSVILFDYNGRFVNKIGSDGRGPDEIQSARYIGFDNEDKIVVIDKSLGLLKEFDQETGKAESYSLLIDQGIDITSTNLEKCEGNWFVGINRYEGNPTDTTDIVAVLNEDFELIKTFGNFDPFFKGNKSIFQDPAISVDCKNELLFTTQWKVPFIQIYDLNNYSLIGRIDKVPPSFRLSDQFIDFVRNVDGIREFLINEQSLSIFLGHTEEYIILPFRNNKAKFFETRNYADREHFLAVYSRDDYSFVGEVPVKGALLGMTKEGYLIHLTNNNPLQLQLLKVVVEKN